jgi:ribosomal RNA-processing protein 1
MSTPKKKVKVKKAKPLIQQLPDSGNYEDGNSKFARALASNDYQTRAKGLEALTRWLSRKSEVSQQDMLKIWKSLYYCFWHSDKAPVQVSNSQHR